MDQGTINIVFGCVMSVLGWFARSIWDRQEAQAMALAAFREKVAGEYVSYDKFNQVMGEVRDDLRYIRGRLDETPQRRQGDH